MTLSVRLDSKLASAWLAVCLGLCILASSATALAVDVAVSSVATATIALRGNSIVVTNAVRNRGVGSSGAFYTGIYLSLTSEVTTSSIFLGQRVVNSLASGGTSTANTSVTIPATLAAGSYYVGAIADIYSQITDTDRSNNAIAGNQITIAGPDLAMTAVSAPSTGMTGSAIVVSNTVMARSSAGASGAAMHIGLYLSPGSSITTSSIYLGSRAVGALASGASNSANTTVTIPARVLPGTYYIAAIADIYQQIPDTDRTNNVLAGNQIMIAGPDLAMISVSSPASAATGSAIQIYSVVHALPSGGASGSGFTVGLYLSPTNSMSTQSKYLGSRTISSLASGATNSASTSITIPSRIPPGKYYIAAIADIFNQTLDSERSNNAIIGNEIIITGNGKSPAVSDVIMTMVSSTVAQAPRGNAIMVTNTVRNQGPGTSGVFYTGIYLSMTSEVSTSSIYLGSRVVSSLASGGTSTANTLVTIPAALAAGNYYVSAIADIYTQTTDTDRSNNTLSGNQISIAGPDLAMTAVSNPSTGLNGSSIQVDNAVQARSSTGAAGAAFSVGFYLSESSAITSSSIYLGSRTISNLASGATNSANTTVTIPARVLPGTYYIIAIADIHEQIPDTDRSNNTLAGHQIRILGPDLAMIAVSSPASAATGSAIPVYSMVQALPSGGASGSGFTIGLYLSLDSSITATSYYLGARSLGSLASGATNSANTLVTIPVRVPPGAYYIIALADVFNQIRDSDKSNNTVAGNVVYIGSDIAPPAGSIIINNGAAICSNTTVTLMLHATDDRSGVSRMQFSNDNATWSNAEPFVATKVWVLFPGDGTKTVYARFGDSAGNWSPAYTSSIELDTVAPTVVITSPAAGSTTLKDPIFNYLVSDGNIVVMLDGSIVSKNAGTILDSLDNGPHTIRVESTDTAGNTGFAEASFMVVSYAPSVSIVSPATGLSNNNMPVLNYTVDYGTVSVIVDGVTVSKIFGDRLDALADGPHTVRVETTDASGFTAFAEVNIIVDATLPLNASMMHFSKIAAGDSHSAAITSDGNMWWWGKMIEFGYRTASMPSAVGDTRAWADVSSGFEGSLAVRSDGSLWGWGYNPFITISNDFIPALIDDETNWMAISAKGSFGLGPTMLDSEGALWETGRRQTLDQIGSDADWVAVSNGEEHVAALKSDGTLWAWGSNRYGQLGIAGVEMYPIPMQINDEMNWSALSAGDYHTIALKTDGSLWAWGSNDFGQLGNGDSSGAEQFTPVQIGSDTNWAAISAGGYHTVALKSDGSLWAWGNNECEPRVGGQLGDGSQIDRYVPVQIGSDTNWVSISAGRCHTLALRTDGSLWTWGVNWGNAAQELGYRGGWTRPHYIFSTDDAILISNGSATTNATSVTLTLNAWDMTSGVAFMKFSTDGTTWSSPEPYATYKSWIIGSLNGTKTVYVMFQDAAGNWSSMYNASIQLDAGPTEVTITSPAAGYTPNKTPVISFSVNKSDAVTTVKVDGEVKGKVSGDMLDSLSEGSHTVRVEAVDANGIIGVDEITFIVDTVFPIVTITSPTSGLTKKMRPVLSYTVNSESTTNIVRLDGKVVQKISGDAFDMLSDGVHTVRVEATSASGNIGYAEVTFTVDTIAPIVTITSPSPGLWNNMPVLTYSVNEGSVIVKVDNVVVDKVSGNTLDALSSGSHSVRVEAMDAARNVGYSQVNFTIDTSSGGIGGNDNTNIYCMGTGTYLVQSSSFASGIIVPTINNEVWIASPSNYSTINGTKALIKGAMDTTIPVNSVSVLVTNSTGSGSYLAMVNGKFFAAQVPVMAGDNSFTITATDKNGGKHQALVVVTGTGTTNDITLRAAPSIGIPTLKQDGKTLLDAALIVSSLSTTDIASFNWDFTGAGLNELTCYSHANVNVSYEHTGLYLTTVIMADTAGNQFKDTAIVNVLDPNDVDSVFKPIWIGMKDAMIRGDIAEAVGYFNSATHSLYSELFTALGQNVKSIGQDMQDIQLIYVTESAAKYRIRRDEIYGGQPTPITFYIYFTRDSNGTWTLDRF